MRHCSVRDTGAVPKIRYALYFDIYADERTYIHTTIRLELNQRALPPTISLACANSDIKTKEELSKITWRV